MEELRKKVIILGVVFGVFGAAFLAMAGNRPMRTEKWVEEHTPKEFAGYTMVQGKDGPDVSYRMDAATYNELTPYGIVARVMRNSDGKQFDTVVIMSSRKESFHDPRVCFTAQNWIIESEEVMPVETKKHGKIGVTVATMVQQASRERSFAAFFYRGPAGYSATTSDLKVQMFKHQLTRFVNAEGVFYRVIPMYSGATKEELAKFIDEFLTATDEASNGLL
jgi:hypothetical protein